MRITSFRAQGYRSLRDVDIRELGKFNIFYGPNGAGKSNILAAMRTMLALLEERARPGAGGADLRDPMPAPEMLLDPRDRCRLGPAADLTLGMIVSWEGEDFPFDIEPPKFSEIDIEVAYSWDTQIMWIRRLARDGHNLVPVNDVSRQRLYKLVRGVARRAFCLVPADRGPREETLQRNGSGIADLLSRGRIKEAFFRAHNHPDAVIRQRYKQLQSLLTGPPFERPPFVVTHDPDSGRLEIVEERAESP